MASPLATPEVTKGAPDRERPLPVSAVFAPLLPDPGLVRGRVLSCGGPSGASLAFAVVAEAVAAGSWLAVVSVPDLGLDAALGLGVDLVRLVRVDVADPGRWVEVLAACLDGFEVVVTVPPPRLGAGAWRKVQARVRSRGSVLVTIGAHRVVTADVELHTSRPRWAWARGDGHLLARRVQVEVAGRRVPRPRRTDLWLPADHGALAPVASIPPAPAGAAGRAGSPVAPAALVAPAAPVIQRRAG